MVANGQETNPQAGYGWTVGVASIVAFMVGLDVLAIMTALPTLHEELDAGTEGLGWTINAYEIGLGALILVGAALGDRYGRTALFIVGVGVFTLASAWAATVSSVEMLIAARAVQGMGGGIATALSLAIISAATPPAKRGAAFGVWGAATGMSVALGPLVGGAIIDVWTWQAIFWVNVPVGAVLILLSLWKLNESRGDSFNIDVLGLVLSTSGAIVLSQAIIRGGDAGWTSPSILLGIAAGVVLLAAFVESQRRGRSPMLPLKMFRNLSFTGGCGASFGLAVGLFGHGFIFAQYLQLALGHDPLGVGVRLLPWVALAPIVSPVAGQIADRIGERPLVVTGLVLYLGSFFAIGFISLSGGGYGAMILPLFIAGVGVSAAFPTVASAVMRSVDGSRYAVAAGVSNTIRQLGAVLGVAVAAATFSTFGGFGSPDDVTDGFGPAVLVVSALALSGLVAAAAIRPPAPSEPKAEAATSGPGPGPGPEDRAVS